MEDTAQAEYVAFEEKVKRTVYMDNLSPQATESVVKNALNQFGNVISVRFIPNYLNPSNTPNYCLVEMENEKQAKNIIDVMKAHPFMMLGMPRPVRAQAAVMQMFDDRPSKPGQKIYCQWLDENNPDFAPAIKLKQLVKKHTAEASFVLKRQREEEEALAQKQFTTLKVNYKKFECIDNVDITTKRLAEEYRVKLREE